MFIMKPMFRHGIIAAIVILGLCAAPLPGLAGSRYVAPCLTPLPPNQCLPLVLDQPAPPTLAPMVPVPVGCIPVPVAHPLKRPEPSLLVGYLCKDRGTQVTLNFSGASGGVTRATTCDVDLQGIWAECALPIVLTHKAEFILSVGHLFPFRPEALQWYRLVDGSVAGRGWNANMRWWDVTTAWTYQLRTCWSAIVGLRWSSLVLDYNQPSNQRGFTNSDDAARLNANAYIPFGGLMWENMSPRAGCLKATVIGFPFLPGDFEHTESVSLAGQPFITKFSPSGEYKSGYFLEASSEYAICRGEWIFGAFARFTAMHVERGRHLHTNEALREADISFDLSNWIFGGKIGFSL
jgi:hypothetical protein